MLELSDMAEDEDEEVSWEEVNIVFEDETVDESTGARQDLVEDFLRFRRNGDTRRLTQLCHPQVRMEIWESVWSPTVYEGQSGVRQFVRERPYSEASDNCDHSHDTTIRQDREHDGFRINWQMKLGWSCITMYTRYEFRRHDGEWKISKIVTGH